MEQLFLALVALLGSSLTAAYISNSWQRAKHDADSLDDCARGIFEHHGRFRMNLGKAYSILYVQKSLGGISIAEKEKIAEASDLCFEAIANLDREKLRLVAIDPSRKAVLDAIIENAIAAGKSVETISFFDSNSAKPNTCVRVQPVVGSIDEAMAALNSAQPRLRDDMVGFAQEIAATRKKLLSDAWHIRKRWWIALFAVLLLACLAFVQFGAKQLVVADGQFYRYNRLTGQLDRVPTSRLDEPSRSQSLRAQPPADRGRTGAVTSENAAEPLDSRLEKGPFVAYPNEAAGVDSLH